MYLLLSVLLAGAYHPDRGSIRQLPPNKLIEATILFDQHAVDAKYVTFEPRWYADYGFVCFAELSMSPKAAAAFKEQFAVVRVREPIMLISNSKIIRIHVHNIEAIGDEKKLGDRVLLKNVVAWVQKAK